MKALLPLLVLAATALAGPLPRRNVAVTYSDKHSNAPAAHAPPTKRDFLEEPIPTPSEKTDLESILSQERPLPSLFLMSLHRLRNDKSEDTQTEDEAAVAGAEDIQAELRDASREVADEAPATLDPVETPRGPETRDLKDGPMFVSDARHLCPFAALVVFWTLGFLACAVQRYVRTPLLLSYL